MHASVGVMAGPAAPQKGRWMCGGREKVDAYVTERKNQIGAQAYWFRR